MGWSDIFGGGAVNPTDMLYRVYAISASTVLQWPGDTATTAYVFADMADVTPSTSNLALTMPDATLGTVGASILIYNAGAYSLIINRSDGVQIVTIPAGAAYFVFLRTNATAAGTWAAFQFGAGASALQASQVASPSVKASGQTLVQAHPVRDVASAYTASIANRAELLLWTGGSDTLTIDAAGTLGDDWFVFLHNAGSGAWTVAITGASGNLIDGAASISLNPNQSAILCCDGSDFYTVGKTTSSTSTFSFIAIAIAGTGNYTLSSGEQGYSAYRFTGILTGNRTVIVPTTVASYIVINATTGAYTLTVKTLAGTGVAVPQGAAAQVVCDGTNVVAGGPTSVSVPVAVADGGTGATTAAAARANLGSTSVGDAVFVAASQAAAQSALGLAAATGAGVRTGTSSTTVVTPASLFDASAPVTLTDAATISVDMSLGINFKVTITANRILGVPTNAKAGQSGVIIVYGSFNLTFGAGWGFTGGAPTLSGSKNVISYFVEDTTPTLVCSLGRAVA